MNHFLTTAFHLAIGCLGAWLGSKTKLPSGPLIGAMLAVIVSKTYLHSTVQLPQGLSFFIQTLIGVSIGVSFRPEMLKIFPKMAIPIVVTTVTLMTTGFLLAWLFTQLDILDKQTAYLCTTPGGLSALLALALEGQVNATLILSFHFLRLLSVILTAPFILKYLLAAS
ncbi:hypothetical protein CSB45_09120 [candidate division KSB3 bacterium]|uniref:AbrB family transcriptional regulator n=1 Tax=candidate division KSB3 bacterium TaxID=2044937 RepID=A0A2G6E553_9BACT|nr:MAG: hypothetical protein CSB45_09120 [candidate division KSB3 bacterium]